MSLKGKIGPEEKIQAVEDYLEMRKGSTQIREELGIRLSTFRRGCESIRRRGRRVCIRRRVLPVTHLR